MTTRRTRAGGILLEVDGEEKATLLDGKIKEVVGTAARVQKPERQTPVLILDVPDWCNARKVVIGLVKAEISPDELSLNNCNRVTVRASQGGRGYGVARVDLSMATAIKLGEGRTVMVGWTRCRVKLIEKRQPTCHQCQEKGLLDSECTNKSKHRYCYSCQEEEHLARDCGKVKSTQGVHSMKRPEGETKERRPEPPPRPDQP